MQGRSYHAGFQTYQTTEFFTCDGCGDICLSSHQVHDHRFTSNLCIDCFEKLVIIEGTPDVAKVRVV